ncbi:hypothetical protein Asp14428_32290 [Actinoplanes sp. NBRC 14428]|uniref:Uncharacterized protein n=1 Tax=Pseudosporangium ferrugineum TaxID=439699 RepID=A0A2T0RIR7_9ACTN|nr:hypothetical protein [Pseudosporangium ferrugineum]PRY21049.1 hypothetical protein CLV70_12151 [Pseudosporangium ferrugineum]BCJ51754.1 hypothetical protein Asp14428_32290 [Actinoplanes sp. NBRC 14428]
MSKFRWAVAVAALAPMLASTPASAGGSGPHPVTPWVRGVEAHTPTWVDIHWQTGAKICDAHVWVKGEHVDVRYPSNTGTYTSFHRDEMLKPGEVGRTAVAVTAHRDKSAFVPLEATLIYTNCKSDKAKVKGFRLTLPVIVS